MAPAAGSVPQRLDRAAASCHGQHFVAHQAQAARGRGSGVEIEGLHRLADVGSRFVPLAGLGEDALADGFGRKPAVALLRNFRDDLSPLRMQGAALGLMRGLVVPGLGLRVNRDRLNEMHPRGEEWHQKHGQDEFHVSSYAGLRAGPQYRKDHRKRINIAFFSRGGLQEGWGLWQETEGMRGAAVGGRCGLRAIPSRGRVRFAPGARSKSS